MSIGKPHISRRRFSPAYIFMKTTGIVAEFNPLHNGHVYIMEESRSRTDCDAVVVAMSGNFVQRGEPAILDKWKRTEVALRYGADLVIEIPTLFSLGNAGSFAKAGVRILEEVGCESFCCGSESGNQAAISKLANLIKDNKKRIDNEVSACIKEGLSYPAAREKAVLGLISDENTKKAASEILSNPNDILTLEYMMAANSAKIVPVERKGASYDDGFDESKSIQSASGIREIIKDGRIDLKEKLFSYVPEKSLSSLIDEDVVFPEDVADLLRYAVLSTDADIIDECPSGGEGLGNLIKSAVLYNESFESIIMACKSKRYTYTRISRLCMQILLGIDRRIYSRSGPLYLRVLGFNKKGRELLSELKTRSEGCLPVITNINKEAEVLSKDAMEMLTLDIKASDVYSLIAGRKIDDYSDHRMKPVIIE